jgi:outer membrane protein insertion porin family
MKTFSMKSGAKNLLTGLIICLTAILSIVQPLHAAAVDTDPKAAESSKDTGQKKAQAIALAMAPLIYMGPVEGARIQNDLMDGLGRRLKTAGLNITILSAEESGGTTGDPTETAFQAARKKRINYLIYGSISKLGNALSVDLRMANVTARTETATLYAQGQTSDLTPLLNELEQQIRDSLKSLDLVADVVVQGNHRVDADAIRQAISLQNQQPFDSKKVSEDIKAIYKLGFFEDVRVDIQDGPNGKVITYLVREKPAVREIKITGNKILKEDKIRDAIDIKPFTVIRDKLLQDNIKKIQALYEEKGYADTIIIPIVTPAAKDTSDITFDIKEGEKVTIKSIEFQGNKAFSSKELRDLMETGEEKPFWYPSLKNIMAMIKGDAGAMKSDMLERDTGRIAAYYHNKGYVDATVGQPIVKREGSSIYITIPVEEGERYGVGTITFKEDYFHDDAKLLAAMQLKDEKIFSQEILRKDILKLTDMYADEGFAYADIDPKIRKDTERKVVDILIEVKTGVKVKFERIEITGNTRTIDKVIRRELRVNEDEPFSATNLKKSKDRLGRLGYFEDINLNPTKGSQEDTMKLDVQVKERPTGTFSIGAGYSSVDKLMFMGEISQRNFLGQGQMLSFKGILGAVTNRFSLNFAEPYLFDTQWYFGSSLYNWRVSYDDYTKDSTGAELTFGYPLTDDLKFFVSPRMDYTKLSDVKENASIFIRDSLDIHTTHSLSFKLAYDTRNDFYLPSKGWYNTVAFEYAGGMLGGDAAFYKWTGTLSYYHPIWKSLVGHARGGIGYVTEGSDGRLPIYEKFFLGGIDSIRGFKSGRVSPIDPATGERIGGEDMAFVQLETIFPLIKDMGLNGVTFLDMGNVWGTDQGYTLSDMRKSVGLGIRWLSPMGPLRVEWGYNLDNKPGEDKSNWEFRMGGTF